MDMNYRPKKKKNQKRLDQSTFIDLAALYILTNKNEKKKNRKPMRNILHI